jgi:hypothetical protein
MDDIIEKAWEDYEVAALVSRPAKALSKREFVAGFNAGLTAAAEEAKRSGQEWLDLWQPNAKLPEVWDFIASDILALGNKKED